MPVDGAPIGVIQAHDLTTAAGQRQDVTQQILSADAEGITAQLFKNPFFTAVESLPIPAQAVQLAH